MTIAFMKKMRKGTISLARERISISVAISMASVGAMSLTAAILFADVAQAGSGAEAIRKCRLTVGQPIVRHCVRSRMSELGGRPRKHAWFCRGDAAPAVRMCVQHSVPEIIAKCRETIGKPLVQACVRERVAAEGGEPANFIEACRISVSWAVRACVWRS